jgi:hypothetical protein
MVNSANGMQKCIDVIGTIQMVPWKHVGQVFTKKIQTGYVFAIGECGTNNTFIGWSGSICLKDVLTKLQYGNARKLCVISILQRSNVYNANIICDTFRSGLVMHKLRGGWYEISHADTERMFGAIDVIKK